MDQRASDQGWGQLQANIESFFKQSLQGDGRRLEYKPRFIVPLPGISSGCPDDEAMPQLRRSASGIAGYEGRQSTAPHDRSTGA